MEKLSHCDSIIHTHLENMTETSIYWKDKKGNYLDINKGFLQITSHSHQDVIGKTDRDLLWGDDHASNIMKNDKEIIKLEYEKIFFEFANSPEGKVVKYLSYKTPLRNRTNKIIGTFGLSFAINYKNLLSIGSKLTCLTNDSSLQSHIEEQTLFLAAKEYKLTKRQIDCLRYLAQGMTMKKIAKQLQLSPKTVEHYIDAIKIKLQYNTRIELIRFAFQLGL